MTHLYRSFNGGKLTTLRHPNAIRNMEYVGYIEAHEYDGQQYKSFTAAQWVSQDQLPKPSELRALGCE